MTDIISLGAGVQSTTLYIMAAVGEITPMPELAIFADTQDEPAHVYKHLDWLEKEFGHIIPIVCVSKGKLSEAVLNGIATSNTRFASIPAFIQRPTGKRGIGRRQCTSEYKIGPINSYTWARYGRKQITMWIGISLDEAQRMKPSRVKRAVHRWPLIERRLTRSACIAWLTNHGYPIPNKSACIFCPYHSKASWRAIKDGDAQEWASVVAFDAALRKWPNMRGEVFLHASMKPIDEVDLMTPQEQGQQEFEFDAECEGMCGV